MSILKINNLVKIYGEGSNAVKFYLINKKLLIINTYLLTIICGLILISCGQKSLNL